MTLIPESKNFCVNYLPKIIIDLKEFGMLLALVIVMNHIFSFLVYLVFNEEHSAHMMSLIKKNPNKQNKTNKQTKNNFGWYSDIHRQISLFSIHSWQMMKTSKFNIVISVWKILIFIKVTVLRETGNVFVLFLSYPSMNVDEIHC